MHDQVANMEVANDVLGAIQSSLKHGFLVGGPLALSNVVLRVYSYYADKMVSQLKVRNDKLMVAGNVIMSDDIRRKENAIKKCKGFQGDNCSK